MTEWETAAPVVAETPDTKLSGKWMITNDDVQISDISLQDYIAVKEKYAKYLPHSAGPYAATCFCKAHCPTVEPLTNSMMMHGHNSKKLMTVHIIKRAFNFIHLLTGENPLQALAVDVSPLHHVNQGSSNSYAIKKKDELEHVAKSNC
uniref:Small ribosomal subunit protein uS7 domain-containing protein n=1 Tax=Mandrillus leucophaeus TaxID=9568 RepID=A0A2K5ZW82_MANLE